VTVSAGLGLGPPGGRALGAGERHRWHPVVVHPLRRGDGRQCVGGGDTAGSGCHVDVLWRTGYVSRRRTRPGCSPAGGRRHHEAPIVDVNARVAQTGPVGLRPPASRYSRAFTQSTYKHLLPGMGSAAARRCEALVLETDEGEAGS
jgi:hypothetical protein